MIVAPNWTTLRHIGKGLDVQDPIHKRQFLKACVQLIADELPDIHAVRLYAIDQDVAITRVATDQEENKSVLLANTPNLAQSLLQDKSLWLADQRYWAYKLRLGDSVLGILEVLVDDLDDDWITWLELLGDKVAGELSLSEAVNAGDQAATVTKTDIQNQTQRLINASQMLLAATESDDIVTAALYAAGENVDGISITLVDEALSVHDVGTTGVTNNLRFTTAYATRDQVQLVQREASVSSLPELSSVTQLRQEIPIVIDNVETDAGYLSGWMREFIAQVGARQAVVFGLTSGEHIVGTLELYSVQRFSLTQQEIDLYTTLAKQIGNTILSQRLLYESLESQAFAAQLVKTNKAIAAAETYEQMAQAVLKDSPQDIYAVAIALFNRPFTLMGTPSQLITEAIVTRERTIIDKHKEIFSATDDARVTYFLHEYLEGSMMLLWNIERPRRPVMAHALVDQLKMEDVDVITSFGLNMSGSLRGLLVLAGAGNLRDPGPRGAGLRALADQLAAVIENRLLFQQTKEALDLIQSQYETSSRVFKADNLLDMLQAVFDFANSTEQLFDGAHLVIFDGESDAQVAARITPTAAELTSEPVDLDLYPASHTLTVIEALEVRDVVEDIFLTKIEQQRLLQDNISAFFMLPIMANNTLGGLLMLTNPQPVSDYLSRDKSRALRSIADQVGIVLENRKLLQNTEANLQQIQLATSELMSQVNILENISQFSNRINNAQNETELLDMGATTLVEALEVDHCGIVLFNEDFQTGVVASEYPETGSRNVTVSTSENPILLNDFDVRSAIAVQDVSNSDILTAETAQDLQASHIEAILLVPLVGQNNELIGSVGLDVYNKPRRFTGTEIHTAQTIAAQMAVGLQNIRLLNDAQQRAEQLQHITDFSQTAQSSLNLAQMIEAALDSVSDLLPVAHVTLALRDNVRGELTTVGGWNSKNGARVPVKRDLDVPTENTTIQYVVETGKYLYIPDFTTESHLTYPYQDENNTRTLLVMPLANLGRILGVLTVGASEVDRYSDTDIALFQQMVNQMSVAIDNAHAYTQNKRLAENKTLANEIAVQLQRQRDITDMIDLTMNEVGRAIGARRGRIRLMTQGDDSHDESGA